MEEDEEEEGIDPSVQWTNAAGLSVRCGDVETLRGLLQGEGGGITAAHQVHVESAATLNPATLEALLMELYPVHIACAAGHREMVQFILTEVGSSSVMMYDRECGATALHTCARFGQYVIARDLLGYGAFVDAHDRGECTPRK